MQSLVFSNIFLRKKEKIKGLCEGRATCASIPWEFCLEMHLLPLVCLGFSPSLAAALCDFLCLKPAPASLCCTKPACNALCFPGKRWQEIHDLSPSLSCFLLRPELFQWPLLMFSTEFSSQDLPPAMPNAALRNWVHSRNFCWNYRPQTQQSFA